MYRHQARPGEYLYVRVGGLYRHAGWCALREGRSGRGGRLSRRRFGAWGALCMRGGLRDVPRGIGWSAKIGGEGRREVSEDFFSLYLTQALCVCALSEWSVRAVDVVRAGWRWGDMFF